MLNRQVGVAAFPTGAHQAAEIVFDVTVRPAPFRLQQKAVIAVPGDEIDHTRHRVRAIDRGRAVGQNLDPLNGDRGNDRGIRLGMTGAAQGEAQTIHQHQGRARRAAAQLMDVGGKIGAVVLALPHLSHVGHGQNGFEDFVERLAALPLNLLRAHGNDARTDRGGAPDAGAGDDHLVNPLVLCLGGAGQRQGREERQNEFGAGRRS